jgi:hypothetical protein
MYLLDLFEAKMYFIIMVVLLIVIPIIALAWSFQKGKKGGLTFDEDDNVIDQSASATEKEVEEQV